MRRRAFVAVFDGAIVAWPVKIWSQQQTLPVVGFIGSGTPEGNRGQVAAFHKGLKQAGFEEHRNVAVEYRWAKSDFDLVPGLVAELVQQHVSVIVATGGSIVALAAKAATTAIPVVFTTGGDPVELGIVASLNRPGGNLTGVAFFNDMLGSKALELIREILPNATSIGVLVNPSNPSSATELRDVENAALTLNLLPFVVSAASEHEIDEAFRKLAQLKPDALLVAESPLFNQLRGRITELASQQALPVASASIELAEAGALIGYGNSREDTFRQAGAYTASILKGAKPEDLPVIRSTIFKLVVNIKTAKALGIEVPPMLLARADEVIE